MSTDRNELFAEAGALGAEDVALHAPLSVLTGEAVDVARFVQHFWKPAIDTETGQTIRPGLSFAGPKLQKTISNEILTLAHWVDEAQEDYLLAAQLRAESPMRHAEEVLKKTRAVLEWHFDDVVNERDAQLARIESLYDDVRSQDTMASALEAYAALAQTVRTELEQDLHFDVSLIDEAPVLARKLRERSAPQGDQNKTAVLLDRRNRLATLLAQRMNLVRAAARFVFRNHPAIVRQATSAYQRRRNAAYRRARKAKDAAAQQKAAST
jgi:hypothetical protein